MSLLSSLVSLGAAGMMLLTIPLDTAAPQNDADGTLFLVNRQWTVTESYEPEDLRQAEVPGSVRRMRDEAAAALEEMFAACKEETGVTLISVSGYRSYASQSNIYSRKLRAVRKDEAKAQEYVAPPGASEHQLGLAMDILDVDNPNLDVTQEWTEAQRWLMKHCTEYGFILRYPNGTTDITGIIYEPWHYRYVGKANAAAIAASGLVFEEYLQKED